MDVAPYLARIKSGADGIFYFEPGDVSILRFFSSYFEMGYNRKGIALTGHWIMTDEAMGGVPAFGKKLVGVVTGGFTSPHNDTPENKHLNEMYYKAYGTKDVINDNVPMGYDSMRFIIKALKSIQGKVEDKEAFLKAMHATEIQGVTGRMSLDKNGNVVRDVLFRKIEMVGGKAQNVVIDKIPQIYQPPQGTTLMPGK